MATRKEVMHNLVKEEAKNLKKYATKKELNRLNFKNLECDSSGNCVYGMMTTDCWNERAINLIEKSCKRVYDSNTDLSIGKCKVSGDPKVKSRFDYWSPIEVLISNKENQKNGNNKKLIDYLKGKTSRLNFK